MGFSLGVLKREEMVHGAAPGVVVGRLARQGLGLVRNRLNCFYNGAAAAAVVAEEPLPRACLVGGGDKDKDLERRSLSTECPSQTPSWFNVSRSLMQQLLGHGAATRHGSLPGGEVGKQLFVSRPTYLSSSPVRHPVLSIAGIRFKGTKTLKKGPKKKKAKEVRMKLKRIRMERKARKAAMSPEETLEYRIAKQKKKIMLHEEQLKKKYQLPEFPERDPDPETLTPEQLYTLKKLGYKNKNYVPVGRRGIYGGTIQNMHMHWKKHETVRLCCDNFPKEKIKAMGEQLERLSGGIVIDIHQAKTIIMWRGRNYKRPKNDIPEVFKNFNKRKALLKSKHEQAINSLRDSIQRWEKDLRDLRADIARKKAKDSRWAAENPGVPNPEPAYQHADQQQQKFEYNSDDDDFSDSATIYDSDGKVLEEYTESDDSQSDGGGIYESDGKELQQYSVSDSESDDGTVLDEVYGLHSENYDSVSDSEHDSFWDDEHVPDGSRSKEEICTPPRNDIELHQREQQQGIAKQFGQA